MPVKVFFKLLKKKKPTRVIYDPEHIDMAH
jgi:hypothetical protein